MINSDQRATFAALADALLDQALDYRPDLVEPLAAALAACQGKDAQDGLDALSRHHPEQFEALTVLAAGAYFLSPAVKAAMPYDAAPRPAREDMDSYIDLLANVVERGFDIR